MFTDSGPGFDSAVRAGYRSALISFWAMVGYVAAQLAQVIGIVQPPLDAILIYATSLAIATPFMLAILALHHIAPPEKRFWSHAAVLFAVMYNVFVTIMYVVQLAAVIPYNVTNPALTVTHHSLFWTLDSLGYIAMGIATLFGSYVFSKSAREKRVKYFFLANALVTPLVAFVYYYPNFSVPILFIGLPWAITAPGSMLSLARHFRTYGKEVLPSNGKSSERSNGVRLSASLELKSILLICSLGLLTNSARAQDTQTLMDSNATVHSVWSFETKTNSIQKNIGSAVGMYWGAVINRSYLFGIGGDVNLSHTVTNYSYLQLLGQYIPESEELLHYGGQLSFGFGSVKDYEHSKTSLFDNFFNTTGTGFYFVEPQLFGELNITPATRLVCGLGYFFAFGLDEANVNIAQSKVTNQSLSGVTLTLSLKFGKF